LVLETGRETVEESTRKLLNLLTEKGIIRL
jgi:hypothetical protein